MPVKRISRRSFLRAGGALIGLPLLEIMLPARFAWGAATPLRYACLYFPHGTTELSDWLPGVSGGVLKMNASGMLDPLIPYAGDVNFIDGMYVDSWSLHPGGVTTFMTGGYGPDEMKVFTCRTVDQLIGDHFQGAGRLHSLALSSDEQSGGESVISGVYGSNISWSGVEQPATRYTRNSQVFDLLVPGGASLPKAVSDRQSILDFAKESLAQLNKQLGAYDKQTMDHYLTNLREVEKKIKAQEAEQEPAGPVIQNLSPAMATCPTATNGKGACADYAKDMEIKMDLIALAFQADRTRVVTHLFDPEPGYRNMNFLAGVSGQSHTISHWRNEADKLKPMVRKIVKFYVSNLAHLIGRLKSMNEAGGTVLDNSLIMFGSCTADGHNHVGNSPMILAGRAGGAISTGKLIKHPSRTNISALHFSIAKKLGLPITNYSGARSVINIG